MEMGMGSMRRVVEFWEGGERSIAKPARLCPTFLMFSPTYM